MHLYPRGLDIRACHPASKSGDRARSLRFPRPTFRLSRKAGAFWRKLSAIASNPGPVHIRWLNLRDLRLLRIRNSRLKRHRDPSLMHGRYFYRPEGIFILDQLMARLAFEVSQGLDRMWHSDACNFVKVIVVQSIVPALNDCRTFSAR